MKRRTRFRITLRQLLSIVTEPFASLREFKEIREEMRRPLKKVPKKVFLIRHPETNEAVDGIYRGDHAEITEKGMEQAQTVAGRLADLNVTHIITSTLPRSVRLAEIIAVRMSMGAKPNSLVKVLPNELFVECRKPSVMDLKPRDESEPAMRPIRGLFDWNYRHSDEENRWRLEVRVWRALRYLAELDAQCVVVVTHGKFLRVLYHYLYEEGTLNGFYRKADRLLKHAHTGITTFSLEEGYRNPALQWQVDGWNDIAHTSTMSRVYADLALKP
ncbi:MAG TPA: histidine phosphatase family protein [Candidatus Paceibacterota bacterium]|nr:histidine phosphatase family protein [Candidatus Paceibacterota bacterium]